MQTFLPYPDFYETARVLDNKRLNKQKVECLQILQTLHNPDPHIGWKNHPAVKQWVGYTNALSVYGLIITRECLNRGFKDTCYYKIKGFYNNLLPNENPPWLGREELHSSHRAALLFKNYEWYKQFNWIEIPIIKYWWPTKELNNET